MKRYFITATGTDIGKTFITAALTRQLRTQGKSVIALKPVISGFDKAHPHNSDTGTLLEAQGLQITEANIHAISPWRFSNPISPDMAAEDERRDIDFHELSQFCNKEVKTDYLLVEGAGGVMSPIGRTYTVLDWITGLDCETILVAGSYLGSISHTLTACQAIIARNLRMHSLIISESETSPVPVERILLTLKHFLPNNLAVHLIPRLNQSGAFKSIIL